MKGEKHIKTKVIKVHLILYSQQRTNDFDSSKIVHNLDSQNYLHAKQSFSEILTGSAFNCFLAAET